ncbi:hypothetical protein F5Y16DRAFT_268884 [Xylariaceae sp. FL0255]|nr:hypothetical protein F5Y16DRAFT_268884 [Xylariaceae sp. FL0255]
MPRPLALLASRCLELSNTVCESADVYLQTELWLAKDIKDELARLEIWCNDRGATLDGVNSLDFQLQSTTNLRDKTMGLLKEVEKSLKNMERKLRRRPISSSKQLSRPGCHHEQKIEAGNQADREAKLDELSDEVANLMDIINCLKR